MECVYLLSLGTHSVQVESSVSNSISAFQTRLILLTKYFSKKVDHVTMTSQPYDNNKNVLPKYGHAHGLVLVTWHFTVVAWLTFWLKYFAKIVNLAWNATAEPQLVKDFVLRQPIKLVFWTDVIHFLTTHTHTPAHTFPTLSLIILFEILLLHGKSFYDLTVHH